MNAYKKLKTIFKQLSNLDYINSIMLWDEAVMMAEGSGEARAEALAMFNGITQKMFANKKNQKLIEAAKNEDGLSTWDKANLDLMEKKYIRATCIPNRLAEKFTQEHLIALQAWRHLRNQNNWRKFVPYLKRVYKLKREIAKRQSEILQLNVYDTLIDEYAPGFNQANIDQIFNGLKQTLPNLIQTVIQKQSTEVIKVPIGPFPIAQQKQVGLEAMKLLQFDFTRGRLDISHHPFCAGNPADVRITTRYNENEFTSSLMAICHETGHAIYEQGMPKEWYGQLVGNVRSMAMHESQSLLIEKQVCSSLAFYEYMTPIIQKIFGNQEAFTAENLYNNITRVKPNFIRVDSDQLTYQLHIILRYEIEKKLFTDEISVEDLPACWNELNIKYLGLNTEKNYQNGVMQDMHWAGGDFGYFPAYSLGRLIAAQLYATFINSEPNFSEKLKQGNFQPLKNWLQENVYSYASSLPTQDLLKQVTGKTLDPNFFIEEVRRKYL